MVIVNYKIWLVQLAYERYVMGMKVKITLTLKRMNPIHISPLTHPSVLFAPGALEPVKKLKEHLL